MWPEVKADTRCPHHEANRPFKEFPADLGCLEEILDKLQELEYFCLGKLDRIVVEVNFPATPLDAGFAMSFFPTDGCVDHLHEYNHNG